MSVTNIHYCEDCKAPATVEAHNILTGRPFHLCEDCAADLMPEHAPKAPPLRQPCAICGETLHLHSMGTIHDANDKPVHRECQRALRRLQAQHRQRQSVYFGRPWSMLTANERRWEEQWNEDHLDDLERDRKETD